MAGKIIKEVKKPCNCGPLPRVNLLYDVGSEWRCDDCGAVWVLKAGIDQREPDEFWVRK